jgi:hypothetical protein
MRSLADHLILLESRPEDGCNVPIGIEPAASSIDLYEGIVAGLDPQPVYGRFLTFNSYRENNDGDADKGEVSPKRFL